MIRVESEKRTRTGKRLTHEDRYYITSLRRNELSDAPPRTAGVDDGSAVVRFGVRPSAE